MISKKTLAEKYASFGYIAHSGELYLPLQYGIQFADECFENKIAIMGIDFIHKNQDKISPVIPINSLDCSDLFSDYDSWEDLVEKSYEISARVLESEFERDPKQLCTLTLLSKDE